MFKTMQEVDHERVADYIVRTVQEDSITSGFQLEVFHDELESAFGSLSSDDLNFIYDLLAEREEIADVLLSEESFDVVLYTDFAPNYEPDECEELEDEDWPF
jgi:hypothetical protein